MLAELEDAKEAKIKDERILVSVVMPIHNVEPYLAESIRSVVEQTYLHWELVMVDDGSTDRSAEIAQHFAEQDPRIRLLRNGRNEGIVKTRNRAFRECSDGARYYAVIDSDDVCLPIRLEYQVAFLEAHPEHAIVGGQNVIIDEHSRAIGERRYPITHEEICRVITRYNPISQPCVMIRRTALEQVGAYDEAFPRCQDYELWLRMAERFKAANLDEFVLKYRVSATQGKRTALRESLRYTVEIQRRWLFHRAFFNPANVVFWGVEHALLWLPGSLVLALFKALTYRRPSAAAKSR